MTDLTVSKEARTSSGTTFVDALVRARYKYIPDHLVGEILAKKWIDNVAPFLFLVITVALFGYLIPGFFNPASLANSARQLGEFGFVVLAMMVVMVAGGIDLSVGSSFALGNFVALALVNLAGRSGQLFPAQSLRAARSVCSTECWSVFCGCVHF